MFPVEDEFYAVPLASVREVRPSPDITALPGGPDAVVGLINVRGEIVPLFDVVRLTRAGRTGAHMYTAIVEVAAGTAALGASGAPVSEELGERMNDSTGHGCSGVYRHGERLATLLDLETLLSVPN